MSDSERDTLLPTAAAAQRSPFSARYLALLIPPLLVGVYAALSTSLAGTPAGLAVEQPLDRSADLVPFPFDQPFSCRLDHSRDPPNRWRVITHNASCATADPAMRRRVAPELVPITHVDETGAFVDALGRQRILRGMNVASKRPPYLPMSDRYHPSLSFSRSDMRLLSSLGLNVIRLSLPWAAVQPQNRHSYDEEYLERALAVVRQSAEEGLYVIISGHQDLYASKFCGHGLPDWTITRDPATFAFPRPIKGFHAASYDGTADVDGLPTDETCLLGEKAAQDDWGLFYLSSAVTRAFWGLYENERGLRDDFAAYWARVAAVFRDEVNVIGFELLNEPPVKARGFWKALWAFGHQSHYSSTERDALQPLYEAAHGAIRDVDPHKLIFIEPTTGNAGGDGFVRESGRLFSDSKTVLASHVYDPNFVNGWRSAAQQIENRARQASALGAGSIVTEFDVEFGRDGRRLGIIDRFLDAADKGAAGANQIAHPTSWIGWQLKEYHRLAGSPPTGSLIDPKSGYLRRSMVERFARPYAEAVHGRLIESAFNATSRVFKLRVRTHDRPGQTVVRVGERWVYPYGMAVDIEPAVRWAWQDDSIVVWTEAAATDLALTIRPRPSTGKAASAS